MIGSVLLSTKDLTLTINLLSVDEAIERMLAHIETLPPEQVDLMDSLGRVLAESVTSDIALPPFTNSAMDGYAVRSIDVAAATQETPVTLEVVMDITAGSLGRKILAPSQAARIMTGAPLPDGADAVIPVEQTNGRWDGEAGASGPVEVYRAVGPGDYVRPLGEDLAIGDRILVAPTIIRPADMGILAALGHSTVSVIRKPRAAILSSGNEIIPVNEPLAPGKIRDSNTYTISGMLRQCGAKPLVLPIARDTFRDVHDQFVSALELRPDILISSAGASLGAADFMHAVLSELGEVGFWKVNLRPGKPFAFGMIQGVPFLGLPGNPVSVMVTFEVLVRPALAKLAGYHYKPDEIMAVTAEDIPSDGRRSYLRVRLTQGEDHQWIASLTGTQSSGALTSMVLADGLLIIPEGLKSVPAGTLMSVRKLRYSL